MNTSSHSHENVAKRTCPYCAEEIRADALKCRFCGSFVFGAARDRFREAADQARREAFDDAAPSRSKDGIILGVCARLANAMELPPTLVRALFVLAGVVLHAGAIVAYVTIWAFMPAPGGGPSPLDRMLVGVRALVRGLRAAWPGERKRDERPPAPTNLSQHHAEAA